MTTSNTRGGQSGNENAKKPRIWSDALRKYAVQNPKTVEKAAKVMWENAAEGDVQAAKEIADRLEGKPTQTIAGDQDNPLKTISKVEYEVVDAQS